MSLPEETMAQIRKELHQADDVPQIANYIHVREEALLQQLRTWQERALIAEAEYRQLLHESIRHGEKMMDNLAEWTPAGTAPAGGAR